MLRHEETWDERPARFICTVTRPVAEPIWAVVQARPHLVAETLRRKVVWTGGIPTWAYRRLQISPLGYIPDICVKYQHSHQISVWSDGPKDALFLVRMFANEERSIVFLSDTRLTGPAAASSAEFGTHYNYVIARTKLRRPRKLHFVTVKQAFILK